jgi:hypothetical protein
VWDDDPTKVVERATAIEDELMNLVWKVGEATDTDQGSDTEKAPPVLATEIDVETGESMPEPRSVNVFNALQVSFTLMLIITLLGLGYKQLAFQILVDKSWIRLAFVAMAPVLVFFSLVSFSAKRLKQMLANMFRSSLHRLLSRICPRSSAQFARCSQTRSTTPP